MTRVLTAQQMRDVEARAIASGAVTGLELMERAGASVVKAIVETWPDFAAGAHRAVVLCGPGNNGGDGFVVARLLAARGWEVAAFFYGDKTKMPPDARVNYDRWVAQNEVVAIGFPRAHHDAQSAFKDAATHRVSELPDGADAQKPPFLVVDALFGIGLTRPISGLDAVMAHMDYLATFRDLNATRLVAVDVPSGFETDTGQVIWDERPGASAFPAIFSDLVVTFHAKKPVHTAIQSEDVKVVVQDIGLALFSGSKKSPPEAQNL